MSTFIKNPNMPKNRVSLGIIDGRVRASIRASLEESGVNIILSERCEDLYEEVSYHPDMYIHHIGDDLIVAAPNAPVGTVKALKAYGFEIIKGKRLITDKYPGDIAYNVARIGRYAICNIEHTDEVLVSLLRERGIKLINVKQGYAKCSICVVDESVLMASDEGILRAVAPLNFDFLKIRPGAIDLYGMSYGFIGGASGFISKDTIAFAGDIELHPDSHKIIDFLNKHGKKVKSLDNKNMMDIGTFIPLKEYCI